MKKKKSNYKPGDYVRLRKFPSGETPTDLHVVLKVDPPDKDGDCLLLLRVVGRGSDILWLARRFEPVPKKKWPKNCPFCGSVQKFSNGFQCETYLHSKGFRRTPVCYDTELRQLRQVVSAARDVTDALKNYAKTRRTIRKVLTNAQATFGIVDQALTQYAASPSTPNSIYCCSCGEEAPTAELIVHKGDCLKGLVAARQAEISEVLKAKF